MIFQQRDQDGQNNLTIKNWLRPQTKNGNKWYQIDEIGFFPFLPLIAQQ